MENIYHRIGSNIREYRKKCHLTQEKLAEKIDITPSHLNRLERGRQKPSIEALCAISDGLSIDVVQLFLPSQTDESMDCHNLTLREIVTLLEKRPKRDVKVILEISKLVCAEIDTARKSKKKDPK